MKIILFSLSFLCTVVIGQDHTHVCSATIVKRNRQFYAIYKSDRSVIEMKELAGKVPLLGEMFRLYSVKRRASIQHVLMDADIVKSDCSDGIFIHHIARIKNVRLRDDVETAIILMRLSQGVV